MAAAAALAACSGEGGNASARRPPAAAPAPLEVPEARTEVVAARLGDSILVVGGLLADGRATARADELDLRTGRWGAAPELPEPLHHAGMAEFGGRVFIAGGYTSDIPGSWTETDEVWSLGAGEREWRAEPPLGNARGALGLAATGGRLVAFGGTVGGQVVPTVEILLAGTDAWRPGPPMAQPREHTAAAASDGRVYAIGGRVGGLDTNLVAVESLDPAAFNAGWRSEPPLRAARGGTAAAAVAGTVCVAGGEEPGGTIAGVECLRAGAWREVATLSQPRHGLGVVAGHGRRLHVLAGGPQPGLFVSAAHEILVIP